MDRESNGKLYTDEDLQQMIEWKIQMEEQYAFDWVRRNLRPFCNRRRLIARLERQFPRVEEEVSLGVRDLPRMFPLLFLHCPEEYKKEWMKWVD